MSRHLLGNLEDETPNVFVNNVCKKQGRGMVGLFLVAFFALFWGGNVLGQTTYTYYALHQNGKGYLKRSGDNVALSNDGTFRYANGFSGDGNCVWVLSSDGYLQNENYYLNVANNRTLYFSVTPVTQWTAEEISGNTNGKKHLKINDGTQDLYLCNDNNTIKLKASPSAYYNACPITITESTWSGPTTADLTLQSPQQITNLRNCYFTQKISYSFVNDAGTTVAQNDKERRVFATLTYVTTSDTQRTIKWDIDEANGIIYNKQGDNYAVTATYALLPADPIARGLHSVAEEKNIKFTLQPKPIVPVDMNYLLFSISSNDNHRYPYDDGIAENSPVKPNGKGGTTNASVLTDPDDPNVNGGNTQISWQVAVDEQGFYTFKNINSGRYLYFDETVHASSDYGTLNVGATTLPTSDTRYKFRLYKTSHDGFGTCFNIIPYSKQFVVFKSDGVSTNIYSALNVNNYYANQTNPAVISLYRPDSNSQFAIYKYEAEFRVRTDFDLSGPSSTHSIGNNTFSANDGWYGKYIKESPRTGGQQNAMVIRDTYCANNSNMMNYLWTVDGLNGYISIANSTTSGTQTNVTINADKNLTIQVTSLPVSVVTGTVKLQLKGGDGSSSNPTCYSSTKEVFFTIYNNGAVTWEEITSLDQIDNPTGTYKLTENNTYSSTNKPEVLTFSGILDCDGHTVSGLTAPLFTTLTNGMVRNLNLKDVNISQAGPVGAIAGTANGASRIYNCGILPTNTVYDAQGNITGFTGSTIGSSDNYCGGLVGLLDGTSRVINCFSYATITGGATVAGIVGYNNAASTQSSLKTIVMNCMFYGDITTASCSHWHPVYGGNMITNDSENGINPYDYFRKGATFDNGFTNNINLYNRSWPAEEKNLVRFEYYRSVLNSNRKLCTWWVNGTSGTAPTDADVTEVGIYKWVLDPSIAPYPILKKWGKYPSIINPDPTRVWDPRIKDANGNPVTPHWVNRSEANEWEGKSLGTLTVNINGGAQYSSGTAQRVLTITDVDTLNYDYCAYKVQLPYYNEVFGDPTADPATQWAQRYANNYTDYVVTGWMITAVSSEGTNHFVANWQTGYNFADRQCTDKDLFSTSGRVFAQGGYYYVPEGVTSITITARWGKAFYLANRGRSIDRVNVTKADYKSDSPFTPAGTVGATFQGKTVYNDLQVAIKALDEATVSGGEPSLTVFDQAIVLISNHQVKNGGTKGSNNQSVGYNLDYKWHPFTIMSADFDFDNEPDFCLELQFRQNIDRPGIQPVRFDFLPVVELGLAVRHNSWAYAIGIFVPQGYFEITETSFMRTTQFEYDADFAGNNQGGLIEDQSPVIINGGEHELFNIRYKINVIHNRTSYFLLGGHAWIHRFAPGPHPNNNNDVAKVCLCAVNAIGGEYPEFYLSGINRPDYTPPTNQTPHCYTNGGKFGMMAGAGYEKVEGDVTFRINRSLIDEFYGGGINGSKPVGGNIDIVIDNSKVRKYCGGPQVGSMESGKTVTTKATGTIFGTFYGGGNGGNSYFRQNQDDGDWASSTIGDWNHRNYRWGIFNPLNLFTVGTTTPVVYDDGTENKGYHCEYECETFNQSNGVADEVTKRGYIHWIQFGTTITGDVSNTLNGCTVEHNFYGGGNLGNVTGTVTSTLTDCTVKGSAFGGGYSADIPTFNAEDKAHATYPTIDAAGTITPGTVPYVTDPDNGDVISYEWTNDLNGMTEEARKASPGYKKEGKWYCWTWKSLAGLGVVTSDVDLIIKGSSRIDGNVFGGGDKSEVEGKTTVKLQGGTNVLGNVYGGGNEGKVHGDSKVFIQNEQNVTPAP